jgi:hypothetical protein
MIMRDRRQHPCLKRRVRGRAMLTATSKMNQVKIVNGLHKIKEGLKNIRIKKILHLKHLVRDTERKKSQRFKAINTIEIN